MHEAVTSNDLYLTDTLRRFCDYGVDDFAVFASNPLRLEKVYTLSNISMNFAKHREIIQYLKTIPDIQSIIQSRYLAPFYSLEYLSEMPHGSLGKAYAKFMQERNYTPDFYEPLDVQDEATYIELRLRQTHDIWHLVSGIGTSFAGEMALQAFMVAQLRYPISLVLLASSMFWTIDNHSHTSEMMTAIFQGWNRGLESKPFLAQRWEEGWHLPLSEWKKNLNLLDSTFVEAGLFHRGQAANALL